MKQKVITKTKKENKLKLKTEFLRSDFTNDLDYYLAVKKTLLEIYKNKDRCFELDMVRLADIDVETNQRIIALLPESKSNLIKRYQKSKIDAWLIERGPDTLNDF